MMPSRPFSRAASTIWSASALGTRGSLDPCTTSNGAEICPAKGQKVLFEPGDGPVLQRLNLLYNRSKHAEGAIT